MLVCVFPKHPKTLNWRAGSRVVEGPRGPVNMPVPGDSEAFWLQPVMAIMDYGARIGPDCTDMLDPASRIRFGSVLPKKARIILCKTGPDPIRMVWSGFRQTVLVCKQAGVQESSGQVPAQCRHNRPATSFPHSVSASTDGRDHVVQNQPGSDLALADCQVLEKRIRSGGKPVFKNHRANASDPIRIVY